MGLKRKDFFCFLEFEFFPLRPKALGEGGGLGRPKQEREREGGSVCVCVREL